MAKCAYSDGNQIHQYQQNVQSPLITRVARRVTICYRNCLLSNRQHKERTTIHYTSNERQITRVAQRVPLAVQKLYQTDIM